jgi:hypothetical protein
VAKRRHSPARLAALGVGGLAFVAASTFAVYALTRPDGSDTPEGAVHQMFGAIDHEDALGVIESLPPSERRVLKDPIVDSTKELQRLGVLKSFSLNDVPGADFEVDGLETSSTTLGDGVVLVTVTGGTIRGTSVPEDIPLGDNLRQIIEDNGGDVNAEADTFTEDLADDHLRLVAIKEDGGWHVSLAYSIAEAARAGSEDDDGHPLPVPDFGGGPTPIGADTPEGAVKGLVDAALAYDPETAIAMTDPTEMRALYDYAPLFLPDLNQAARDARSDGDTVVKVDRLDTTVEGDGPVRRVTMTGFDVTIGSADDNVHMVFDGSCYDTTSTYATFDFEQFDSLDSSTGRFNTPDGRPPTGEPRVEHQHVCAGDPPADDSAGSPFGDLGMFGATSSRAFAITVTEVDGRWYVSPVRTILDTMVEGLRALQPEDIQKMGDFFGSSTESSEGFSSSEDFPSSSGSAPTASSTIPNEADPGLMPSPTTPDDDWVAESLFPGLSPSTRAAVSSACAAEIGAYSQGVSGPDDLYQVVRDVYGCAAGVVPGYADCLPALDAVIAAAPSSDVSAFLQREQETWDCTSRVRG